MTTARDTPPPYQTTASAGGKLRKTPLRRRNTPYARPPTAIRNKNPNLLTKIVDSASRLLYAGANKLFGVVFGNRNMFLPLQRPSEINEEPQNLPREEGQHGNSASISAATGISDLEQMLQQKTFTRSEIERLTALLHSRTESSSADVVERDVVNPYSSPSSLLRLEASTSGSLQKHGDERDNLHAAISTPMVTSRVLEEDTASPAELAKAYMGSRPTKVALRQDIVLHNNATSFSKSPITSIAPKIANGSTGFENGFTTPRSRGRSAMYSMARTSYARSPSTFTQKGITSSYGRDEALTSSQSAFQHGGKMALKRRSSVLDDDIGSGGSLRRTRQKANLLTLRDKRELGYTSLQQPDHASQKLPLMNESEPKVVKGAEENRYTSMHGTGSVSGYANVPTKSTQTATKILQHLEKPSPKEKSSGSTKSPTKLTLDMLHGQALRSLEKVDSPKLLSYPLDNQKSEVQHHERLHDSRELTSKGKEKVEDNGSRKFPIPRSMMTSVNGELSVTSKDKAPAVRINEPTLKLPAEPPQKKRAFQMSAPEDDSFEIDDDDDDDGIQTNGHVSLPLVENNKQETALPADIVATSTLPGVSRTPALVENNKQMFPEVVKVPEQAVPKEAEKPVSSCIGGSVSEQGLGFKLLASPPLTTNTQNNLLPQSLQMDNVALEKDSNSFQLFGTSAERVSPFAFSANGPSDSKPSASSDPKALESTSVSNSVTANDHVKLPESNKVENGNDQKSANIFGKVESNKTESGSDQQPASIFGKSESNKDGNGIDQKAANIFGKLDAPPSTALPATPTNGIFSFGISTNNVSTTPNTTPLSNPNTFPSVVPFTASSATTSSLFNFSSPNVSSTSIASTVITTTVISSTTTTTTTPTPAAIFSSSTPTPAIPSSVPAPVFSFGSAASTAPTISVAETGNTNVTNDKDLKSNLTNSPFASTPFATTTTIGSGLFGFSSPAATSTTNNQSQASFFNVSNGSQANTQASMAVAPSVPFLFGSGTTSIPSSTSGTSPFSSSAPAIGTSSSFGISSMTASSEGKSGNSTSGPATSVFGSTWEPAKSSGFGTTFNFGASATPTPSATTSPVVFGASNTGSSTGFSFGAGATTSSFSTPTQNQSPFGNPTPVFGTGATPNNNDHMSMDSMAEDSMQTPTPVPAFGQTPVASPGFMFGSATPTPTPAPAPSPAMPSFQFGGQPNQALSQNPTPASASFQFGGQPNQAISQNPIPASTSFQFGGQPNQTPPQNPFQSSSVEFNAGGGSFSLGSNGGDKSSRRIVRVRKTTGRKK